MPFYNNNDPVGDGLKFVGKGWLALVIAGVLASNPVLVIGTATLAGMAWCCKKAAEGITKWVKYIIDKRHEAKMNVIYLEQQKLIVPPKKNTPSDDYEEAIRRYHENVGKIMVSPMDKTEKDNALRAEMVILRDRIDKTLL